MNAAWVIRLGAVVLVVVLISEWSPEIANWLLLLLIVGMLLAQPQLLASILGTTQPTKR